MLSFAENLLQSTLHQDIIIEPLNIHLCYGAYMEHPNLKVYNGENITPK